MVYREYCIGEDDYDAERELHFRKRTLSRCISQGQKQHGSDEMDASYAAKMKQRFEHIATKALAADIANEN